MTNDFEGEMQNLKQKEEEGGSEDEDEDKEEPEHDMGGELDEDNQEVVDEKLWDKEEDDLKPQANP